MPIPERLLDEKRQSIDLFSGVREEEHLRFEDVLNGPVQQKDTGAIRFAFVDSYKRRIGELPPVEKPQRMEQPIDHSDAAPNKPTRKKEKAEYQKKLLEYEQQARLCDYFEAQYDSLEAELKNQDESGIQLWRPGDHSAELAWIKTEFVQWEDKNDNESQMEIVQAIHETREMLALEMSRAKQDENKIEALETIAKKLATCVEGYAKNERDLYKVTKLGPDFASDVGLDASGINVESVKKNAVMLAVKARRETRHLLFDEIFKLRAFAICAVDGQKVKGSGDLAYLKHIGINMEKFNRLEPSGKDAILDANAIFNAYYEGLFKEGAVSLDNAYFAKFENALKDRYISDNQRQALLDKLDEEIAKAVEKGSILDSAISGNMEEAVAQVDGVIQMRRKDHFRLLTEWRKKEQQLASPALVMEKEVTDKDDMFAARLAASCKKLNDSRNNAYGSRVAAFRLRRSELRLAPHRRAIKDAANPDRIGAGNLSVIAEKLKSRAEYSDVIKLRDSLDNGNIEDRKLLHDAIELYAPPESKLELKAAMDLLLTNKQITSDNRELLLSASEFIITPEDESLLQAEIADAVLVTLETFQRELDKLQVVTATDPEELRYHYMDIGERIDTLRVRAENALAGDALSQWNQRMDGAMQSLLPAFREQLYDPSITDSETIQLMDKLTLASGMHPGIVNALNHLDQHERSNALKVITGADVMAAALKLDELAKPYPELDEVCLALKNKALKGKLSPDGEGTDDPTVGFSIGAQHRSGRIVRLLRDKLKAITEGFEENDLRREILKEYENVSDRQLLEKLLSRELNTAGAGNIEGESSLMYIRAMWLVKAGELGRPVTLEELKEEACLSGYSDQLIKDAIESDIDDAKDQQMSLDVIDGQIDLYDPQRFGNRALNWIGDLVGKDLSDERLFIRSLRGMLEMDGRYEARQLMSTERRDLLDLTIGMNGVEVSVFQQQLAIRKTKKWWFTPEYSTQLARAGAAAARIEENKKRAKERAAKQEASQTTVDLAMVERVRERDLSVLTEVEQKAAKQMAKARMGQAYSKGAKMAVLVMLLQLALEDAQNAQNKADIDAAWKRVDDILGKFPQKFDLKAMTHDTSNKKQADAVRGNSEAFKSDVKNTFTNSGARDAAAILQKYFHSRDEEAGLTELAKAAVLEEYALGDTKNIEEISQVLCKSLKLPRDSVAGTLRDIKDRFAGREKASGVDMLGAAIAERKEKFGKDPDDDTSAGVYLLSMQVLGICRILERTTANDIELRNKDAKIRQAEERVKYAKVLEQIAEKIDEKSNLYAMALDTNENNRRAMDLTKKFRAAVLVTAKLGSKITADEATYAAYKNSVAELFSFINMLGLSERASAALADHPEILNQTTIEESIVGGKNANNEQRLVREELTQAYKLMHDKREAGDATGEELLKESRESRDKQLEGDAAVALTVYAISRLISDGSTKEWEEKKSQLAALGRHLDKKTNLLAITKEKRIKADSRAGMVYAQFASQMQMLIDSPTQEQFNVNARNLIAIFNYFKLSERAEAALSITAIATEGTRKADIDGVFNKALAKTAIREAVAERYEQAAEINRLQLESRTGKELIDERREQESALGNTNEEGATLALSVLGINELVEQVLTATGYTVLLTEIKAAAAEIYTRISGADFNLLAMQRKTAFKKGSEVERVRLMFLELCNRLANSADAAEMKAVSTELRGFYDIFSIDRRASAALEAKDAEQSFKSKLDNALGTSEATRKVRERLSVMETAMGREARANATVESRLYFNLSSRLMSVTTVEVMNMFYKNVVATDFSAFHKRLKEEGSSDRELLLERLREILAGLSEDSDRPLSEAHVNGLAIYMADQFLSSVEDSGYSSAKEWLSAKAQKSWSMESAQEAILKLDKGEEAARAFRAMLNSITVENAVAVLAVGEKMALKNYTGGGLGASGEVAPGATVGVDLEAAVNNDLTIERADEKLYSVYLGKSFMGRVTAKVGVDVVAQVSAEAGVSVSGEYAQGVKLDFDTPEVCMDFLKELFDAVEEKAPAARKKEPGAPKKARKAKKEAALQSTTEKRAKKGRKMLKMASQRQIITKTSGSLELFGGISVSIGHDSLTKIDAVKKATDVVSDFTARHLEQVKEWTGEKIKSVADSMINGLAKPSLIASVPWGERYIGILMEKLTDKIEELSKTLVETASEKVSDTIKEKLKELVTDISQKAINAVKGEEESKEGFEVDEDMQKTLEDEVKAALLEALGSKLTDAFTKDKEGSDDGPPEVEEATTEEKEACFTLIDANLSVGLSLSKTKEIRKTGGGTWTEKTTSNTKLTAQFESHLMGADLYKNSGESEATVVMEKRFVGDTLVGAVMGRNYNLIGGEEGAKTMKALLSNFGINNETLLERTLNAQSLPLSVEINAELTQSGLEKYKKAISDKNISKANFILADRTNYRIKEILVEVEEATSSNEVSLSLEFDVEEVEVKVNYKSGTEGSRTRIYGYVPKSA